MAYFITEDRVVPQAIADTSTTQLNPLGTIVNAVDLTRGAGEFIYLAGVADTAIGSWALYLVDDHSTTLAVANDIGPLAVAMSANVAGPNWGWYQLSGKASALMAASFADNGDVYLTATPGSCDDADVAGDSVRNAKGASTIVGAGLADVEIARPFVDNGNAD